MNKDFIIIDERMTRFNSYLDTLYFAGKLKLAELQSFRDILEEIKSMCEKLKNLSVFGFMPYHVKKDINRLNTELMLMEYNVSLISTGSLCAA